MSVLGLTDAALSKSTLELLKTTLKLTVASLTELDLTYAYTGQAGASIVRDALLDPHCQLIRLGLAGNSLRDRGVEIVHAGLVKSSTLTYLGIAYSFKSP
jgi:hypothetical protein